MKAIHLIAPCLFALALGSAACAPTTTAAPAAAAPAADASAEGWKPVSVDDVAQKVAASEPKTFVFDCNQKETFASGHVPKAKWLEHNKLDAAALPGEKDATLIFYCGSEKCMASHDAAKAAHALGYSNVYVMTAGIKGWKDANKPLEK